MVAKKKERGRMTAENASYIEEQQEAGRRTRCRRRFKRDSIEKRIIQRKRKRNPKER